MPRISNHCRRAVSVSLVDPTAGLGVVSDSVRVDMNGVARRKRRMVQGPFELHFNRITGSGAELVMGGARFTGPTTVQVTLDACGTRLLQGERVFLDVGTRASVPGVPGLAAAAPSGLTSRAGPPHARRGSTA
jgi:pyruvate/2-oxoglutarate dehydrogenase complex dihydrolipoamide dehydrogenase (E3) component